MLTPEILAKLAVGEPDWWQSAPEFLIDFDLLRAHVAVAIRAAQAAQRERDAQIADGYIDTRRVFDDDGSKNYHAGFIDGALAIREAIRAAD